jgi:3-oxoacyl-[acyl-carrier protein] reductase/pteridine reductase
MADSGTTAHSLKKPLLGRTALITGGARRIGRGIGLALAAAGADVAFTYNRSASDAEQTLALLRSFGVRAHAVVCDLHDPAAVSQVMPRLADWLGSSAADTQSLDLLVNNAGAFEVASLDELTVEQWDAMFATNTRAPFLMAQAALPYLRNSGTTGRIINTGSEPDEAYAHFAAKTPMQRNGKAEDVAELVVYLAGATPFLTGQVIAMDGGLGL